ncbi:MAG TPA: TadE family type IV pilus minor pilin [Jatrophihabitans sp.]
MVTAELAVALPTLVILTFAGVLAIGVGQARVRCADGAREAARAVARGDPGAATSLANLAAGRSVAVSSSESTDADTSVTVTMVVHPVSWLPAVTVSETAVVATEPGHAAGRDPP